MESTLPALVLDAGPWVLLVLAWAETSFVTGLVVPAGFATAAGAMLAGLGYLPLVEVAGFAATGAALGDSTGFWIGRRSGDLLERGTGRTARVWRRHGPRLRRIFRRHPFVSVTLARLVAFVRTLMPLSAGGGRLSYPHFLVYDLPGVAAWTAGYVAVGLVAGESWRRVVGWVGAGWAAFFAAAVLVAWLGARIRRRKRA